MLNYEYRVKHYFTFDDVLNVLPLYAPQGRFSTGNADNWFSTMLGHLNMELTVFSLSTDYSNSQISDIVDGLMNLVYSIHAEDYVYQVDNDDEDYSLTNADLKEVMAKLLDIICLTLPRYIPMLKAYEKFSPNPVDKIESSNGTISKSRFNDTPQNTGGYGDIDHASNESYAETESNMSMDSGSIMQRLDDMYKNFRAIIRDWASEFNSLFLKEVQL